MAEAKFDAHRNQFVVASLKTLKSFEFCFFDEVILLLIHLIRRDYYWMSSFRQTAAQFSVVAA